MASNELLIALLASAFTSLEQGWRFFVQQITAKISPIFTLPPPHHLLAQRQHRSRIEADMTESLEIKRRLHDRYHTLLAMQREHWWRATLLHPDHFTSILNRIQPFLPPTRRTLTPENRLLLVIEWMRTYPTLFQLTEWYGISESNVWSTINEIVPILAVVLREQCSDLCNPEKKRALPKCDEFPSAIGIIDCTHHEIEQPARNAHLYYRGDQGNCSITTQLVVSFTGKPIHVASGYPGSCHDLRVFRDSHIDKYLNEGEVLMADQGYLRGPFIAPYDFQDPDPQHEYFNKRLSHYRINIERTNRYIKRWRALSTRWRGRPSMLAQVVIAVAGICAEQIESYPIA